MANLAEIDSASGRLGDDAPLAPEAAGEPYLGLADAEDVKGTVPHHATSKQVEEEVVDASEGRKDEREEKSRPGQGDSVVRVNVALLLSVTVAAVVVGTTVAIAKKLRGR